MWHNVGNRIRGVGAYIALMLSVCLFTAISSQHLLAETPAEFKPDGNWLATVQKDIEAQEFRPSKQMVGIKGEKLSEPKWHITNRAHGLRSFVSKDGWEIIPRPATKSLDPKDLTKDKKELAKKESDTPNWYWRYRLSTLSRGRSSTKLSHPIVRDENETVYLSYTDSVTEWYKNSKPGIEQGFEIKERPYSALKGELVLVGDIKTDLTVLNSTKDKIGFSKNSIEVFQYAGLKVLDASGKTLPSWLSYVATTTKSARQLRIHIDDSEAIYPIVVDPLAT